jgi:hypothetical protein
VIQWVLQACADPEVRLWKIYWAAAREEGSDARTVVSAFLPVDRGLRRTVSIVEKPKITVELMRGKDEGETRVKLLDQVIGAGDSGFATLEERVGFIQKARKEIPGQISAWGHVPYGEVVRALDIFRKTGVRAITFVGAAPPDVKGGPAEDEVIEDPVIEESKPR